MDNRSEVGNTLVAGCLGAKRSPGESGPRVSIGELVSILLPMLGTSLSLWFQGTLIKAGGIGDKPREKMPSCDCVLRWRWKLVILLI